MFSIFQQFTPIIFVLIYFVIKCDCDYLSYGQFDYAPQSNSDYQNADELPLDDSKTESKFISKTEYDDMQNFNFKRCPHSSNEYNINRILKRIRDSASHILEELGQLSLNLDEEVEENNSIVDKPEDLTKTSKIVISAKVGSDAGKTTAVCEKCRNGSIINCMLSDGSKQVNNGGRNQLVELASGGKFEINADNLAQAILTDEQNNEEKSNSDDKNSDPNSYPDEETIPEEEKELFNKWDRQISLSRSLLGNSNFVKDSPKKAGIALDLLTSSRLEQKKKKSNSDAVWDSWSSWSTCNEFGKQFRYRKCSGNRCKYDVVIDERKCSSNTDSVIDSSLLNNIKIT